MIFNKGAKKPVVYWRRTASLKDGVVKTDIHMEKTEARPLSLTLCKISLKMDQKS
jgi:hypothetical protein